MTAVICSVVFFVAGFWLASIGAAKHYSKQWREFQNEINPLIEQAKQDASKADTLLANLALENRQLRRLLGRGI